MKEALKLALEALEGLYISSFTMPNSPISIAITAIKAALAQQDGQSNFCAQCEAFARELKAVKQALAQPAKELTNIQRHEQNLQKLFGTAQPADHSEQHLDMVKAQPAQEPVSVTYKEVADAMNSLWNGTLEQHQIAEQMANKKLFTTPQQRPWVGLTEAQFLEAVRLAEAGNYLVAFVRIQEWLKEQNT
jgi:hypothetical protein